MHTPPAPQAPWRFGLRLQLSLALALLGIVCIAGVAVGLATLVSLRDEARVAVMVSEARRAAADRVALATLLCRRYEKDILLTLDQPTARTAYFGQWQEAYGDLRGAIDAYAALATTAEEREQAADWQTNAGTYFAAITDVERAMAGGAVTTPQAANTALEPFKEPIRLLTDSAMAVAERERGQLQTTNAALLDSTAAAVQLLGGISLVVVLFTAAWSLWFPRRLLRPIHQLRAATQRFAQGEVGARAGLQRRDELGELGASFDRMVGQIQVQLAELDQRALVEEQNKQLRSLLDLVRDLETPAIPLLDGVLLVPIVGNLDTRRTSLLQERVLDAIFRQRARAVLLDLTGVAVIDTQVAQAIQQLVAAIKLLGTQTIVTGISPQVAQTVSQLGLGFEDVQVAGRVQDGVAAILQITPG